VGQTLHRLNDLPWLWSRWAGRSIGRLAAVSVALFALGYLINLALAIAAGGAEVYLRDLVWAVGLLLVTGGAFILGYAPRVVERFLASLRPWVANPPEELTLLEAGTLRLMLRPFWLFAALFLFTSLPNAFVGDTRYTAAGQHGLFQQMNLFGAPIVAFFAGGGAAMAVFGVGALAYRLRRFDLKPGFILYGGKSALHLFNQLLWAAWMAFVFPLMLSIALYAWATLPSGELDANQVLITNLYSLAFVPAFVVPSLLVPHLLMNHWLAAQKTEELARLREELRATAFAGADAGAVDIQRRELRYRHLQHEFAQVQAFRPTLVDTRFLLQIGTSIAVAVGANFVLSLLVDLLNG